MAVLREHGPAGLTTRRVADQAGVSLGTVHYAFRDKDELLAAVTDELLSSFAGALERGVRPERGLRRTIRDALDAYWQWVTGDRGLALAVMETLTGMLRDGRAAEVYETSYALVADVLAAASAVEPSPPRIGAADLARLLVVAADGLTLAHLASGDARRARRDLGRLADALASVT